MIVTLFLASGLGTSARGEPNSFGPEDPHKLGLPALAAPSSTEPGDLKSRVSDLEAGLARLEAEVEILKTQNRMVIKRTQLSYRDAAYLMIGLSLLLPRKATFPIGTDSGLGAQAGVGRYLGQNHVIEASFAWDAYLAFDLQYRFEFHTGESRLSWGPVVGYRTKLYELPPFDKFLSDADQVRSTFYYVGGILGFPVGGASLLRAELLYMHNVQQIITASLGVHFFL
jgi:hypothetical protein